MFFLTCFRLWFISWKSAFSSFSIFTRYLGKSAFILSSMIHSLILVLPPPNKQRTDYKNLFFLSTNSSSCMLFLNAHKWPGNTTSLGLETTQGSASYFYLPIFKRNKPSIHTWHTWHTFFLSLSSQFSPLCFWL